MGRGLEIISRQATPVHDAGPMLLTYYKYFPYEMKMVLYMFCHRDSPLKY